MFLFPSECATFFGLLCSIANVASNLRPRVKGPEKQKQIVAAAAAQNAISKFLNRRIFLASPCLFLQELEVVYSLESLMLLEYHKI
jgi:hypothetical protein